MIRQGRIAAVVLLGLLVALLSPSLAHAQDSAVGTISDAQHMVDPLQDEAAPEPTLASDAGQDAGLAAASGSDADAAAVPEGDTIEDDEGDYLIASQDGTYVLDVCSGSRENGANVQLYERNGTLAQCFSLRGVGGYYQIISDASGKALSASDEGDSHGTNVYQWDADMLDEDTLFAAIQNDDGTVSFRNVGTGLMLDVAGGEASDGANVQLSIANGSAGQRFALVRVTDILAQGVYELAPRCASDLRLDVAGGSEADDANVQLWSANGSLAQKWSVSKVEDVDNTYTLKSLASGRYLSVGGGGASDDARQRGEADEAAQWVASVTAGCVTFTNRLTGLALDVEGGGQAAGTNVQTFAANGEAAQEFELLATPVVSDGWYELLFSQHEGQALDVSGSSRDAGANVQSYARNDGAAQTWYLSWQGDGYVLKGACSKLALDVLDGSAVSGQNVRQWEDNGSKAQRWSLTYTGGAATFKIASSLDESLVLATVGEPQSSQNVAIVSGSAGDGSFKLVSTAYSEPVELTELQQRVCDSAKSTPSPGQGLCARWVSQVFGKAGVGTAGGNARDMYWSYCKESERSELRVGMIVAVPSHTHTSAGRVYGHVAIYIGNGLVMDNVGSIRTCGLDEWIEFYGTSSQVRWGWLLGKSLA